MDTRCAMEEKENIVRGFTLVELLAVIVVLAIVMLLAVQAVLPQVTIARKNAFAIEANAVIEAAQSYVVTEALTSNLIISEKGLCVSTDILADGYWKGDVSKYNGFVTIIPKEGTQNYLYTVYLTNQKYMANGLGVSGNNQVSIIGTDIKEGNATNLDKIETVCQPDQIIKK